MILRLDQNNKSMGIGDQHNTLGKFIREHFGEGYDTEPTIIYDKKNRVVHLDIYWFKTSEKRNYHTLVTAGMSYLPMAYGKSGELHFRELVMCIPPEWNVMGKADAEHWPLATLYNTVQFPHMNSTVIDFGHTLEHTSYSFNTDTQLNGKRLAFGKLQLFTDGLVCKINEDVEIEFMAMIPVTKPELTYMKHKFRTIDSLEDACKFLQDNKATELLDLNRPEFRLD